MKNNQTFSCDFNMDKILVQSFIDLLLGVAFMVINLYR